MGRGLINSLICFLVIICSVWLSLINVHSVEAGGRALMTTLSERLHNGIISKEGRYLILEEKISGSSPKGEGHKQQFGNLFHTLQGAKNSGPSPGEGHIHNTIIGNKLL